MLSRIIIIILNWNRYDLTNECLRSLFKVESEPFDILLIDNASDYTTSLDPSLLKSNVKFIQNEKNIGFSGGNNIGIEYALNFNYEYLLFLNNDTIVHKNFLFHLYNYLDNHPNIGAVQPMIYNYPEISSIWNSGSFFLSIAGLPIISRANPKSSIVDVDWITGCAFFVRASVLKESGFFNDKYFAYYEDIDLSFRIIKLGYKLKLISSSVIYHHANGSTKKLKKDSGGYLSPLVHYLNIRNHIWFIKDWLRGVNFYTALLIHIIYVILLTFYFILRLRYKKMYIVQKAFYDGIITRHN